MEISREKIRRILGSNLQDWRLLCLLDLFCLKIRIIFQVKFNKVVSLKRFAMSRSDFGEVVYKKVTFEFKRF